MKAYLEVRDLDLLEQSATNVRDRLLIRLLGRTGCRISEALALRPEDVDYARQTLRIPHLKARVRLLCPACSARLARMHRYCPGCGGHVAKPIQRKQLQHRLRRIQVDRQTTDMLKGFIAAKRQTGRQVERVFGISAHQAWVVVRRVAAGAGLGRLESPETGRPRGISPHRLRDAFATVASQRDDSMEGLRMLQEQLGHSNINTTARYRKVSGQEQKQWYLKVQEGPQNVRSRAS